MPLVVVNGATIRCSMGTAPAKLAVLPPDTVGHEMAVADDKAFAPNVKIAPFAMCRSPTNPQVAAATAAALGVLTPQPCVPMTMKPWTGTASNTETMRGKVLIATSRCDCQWGGMIEIVEAGQIDIEAE